MITFGNSRLLSANFGSQLLCTAQPKTNVPNKTQGYADIRQLATDKERVWLCVVPQSVVILRGVVSLLSVRVFVVCTCDVLRVVL